MKKIIITNEYDLWKYLFSDIEQGGGTVQTYPFSGYNNHKAENLAYRLCTSQKLGFNRVLEKLWFHHVLEKWGISPTDSARVIFLNPVLPYASEPFLCYLSSLPNIELHLLFIDTVQCIGEDHMSIIRPLLPYFHTIYTYDREDALQYHWELTFHYYSKLPTGDTTPSIDVFLTLYNKGRIKKAIQLYDYLESRNIRCCFVLNGVDQETIQANQRNGILYNKQLTYRAVIDYISRATVIAELCQSNQHSQTLRTLEAFVYRKKLITDNNNIVAFPYFNADTMIHFSDPNDLDSIEQSFFTTAIPVNEEYDNRFSPLHLF